MREKRVYLVRHGQTDWNLAKRLQALSDIPLNENGIKQAEMVHLRLQSDGVEFDAVFSSPLSRARKTAEIVAKRSQVSIQVDERLREIALGDYEGLSEQDLKDELGQSYSDWRAKRFDDPAPSGEDFQSAYSRALEFLQERVERGENRNSLIVGHQGINMAISSAISGDKSISARDEYMQANDEYFVWDFSNRRMIEKRKI